MIAIVDSGAGNLNSVKKAFDYLGVDTVVTNQAKAIATSDKIVLPGVGHFSSLKALKSTGMSELLSQSISAGKPFLGICLGMQWLFAGSDECDDVVGAGIFPGKCRRFAADMKSPHVGWNSIAVREGSRLFRGVAQNSFVYYTHSFHAPLISRTSAGCEYGTAFSAAVEFKSVFGVQFHPEKSGDVGLAILKNFCEV